MRVWQGPSCCISTKWDPITRFATFCDIVTKKRREHGIPQPRGRLDLRGFYQSHPSQLLSWHSFDGAPLIHRRRSRGRRHCGLLNLALASYADLKILIKLCLSARHLRCRRRVSFWRFVTSTAQSDECLARTKVVHMDGHAKSVGSSAGVMKVPSGCRGVPPTALFVRLYISVPVTSRYRETSPQLSSMLRVEVLAATTLSP